MKFIAGKDEKTSILSFYAKENTSIFLPIGYHLCLVLTMIWQARIVVLKKTPLCFFKSTDVLQRGKKKVCGTVQTVGNFAYKRAILTRGKKTWEKFYHIEMSNFSIVTWNGIDNLRKKFARISRTVSNTYNFGKTINHVYESYFIYLTSLDTVASSRRLINCL